MPNWKGSNRRERLPSDWDRRRKKRLKYDGYRCTYRNVYGERCKARATDVDHHERGDDHSHENLRSLCEWHHDRKSAQEGAEARAAKIEAKVKKFTHTEPHPGALS